MTGYVYVIACGPDHVKIGFSKKPALRLVKIQADNPRPCKMIGCIPASREDEATIHAGLAQSRINGEWFDAHAPAVVAVCDLARGAVQHNDLLIRKRKREETAFGRWLLARGMTNEEFARIAEVSQPTISRLVRGKMWPSWDLAARIFDATDGQVTPNDFLATRRASVDAEPDAA